MRKDTNCDLAATTVFYCNLSSIQDIHGSIVQLNQLKHYRQHIWRLNGNYCSLPVIEKGLELGKKIQLGSELLFLEAMNNVHRHGLSALVRVNIAPILGGFRDLTPFDIPMLRLKAHLELGSDPNQFVDKQTLIEEISAHPLIQRMKFVPTTDVASLCQVMARVVDVRWFMLSGIHHNRFLRYFRQGRFKSSMIRYLDDRYRDAVNCWYNPLSYYAFDDNITCDKKDFLSRFYYTMYFRHGRDKAILKTTKKYLIFMFYNWLDCLYPRAHDPFFDADVFFETEEDKLEWQQWLAQNQVCMSLDRGS